MGSNLPIKGERKSIIDSSRKNLIKVKDFGQKVKRAFLGFGGATAGLIASATASTLGAPVVSVAILAGSVFSAAKGISSVMYNEEPGSMFVSKKQFDGSLRLFQDSLKMPSYLRGISNADKASIMGLQILVGLQRAKIKSRLTQEPLIDVGEKKVYPQEYSTVTHSINLSNLRTLEKAGYIEILSEEEEFKHNVFSRKNKPSRRLMIFEKIGFSNTEGLKKIFEAAKNRDKDELDSLRKTFKKVTFRLTDKEMDFEDIYKKINGITEYEDDDEKSKLKGLRMIFKGSNDRIPGILSHRQAILKEEKVTYSDRKRKLDIRYDKFGRPFIIYNSDKSFGERLEENFRLAENSTTLKQKEFDEFLKDGVDLSKFKQSIKNQSSEILQNDERENGATTEERE